MATIVSVGLDAAGIEHRLAIVAGYLGDAGYQAGLTPAQVVEVHEGIVTLAALQTMCSTLRRFGTLQLELEPGHGPAGARAAASLRRPRRQTAGRRPA